MCAGGDVLGNLKICALILPQQLACSVCPTASFLSSSSSCPAADGGVAGGGHGRQPQPGRAVR